MNSFEINAIVSVVSIIIGAVLEARYGSKVKADLTSVEARLTALETSLKAKI